MTRTSAIPDSSNASSSWSETDELTEAKTIELRLEDRAELVDEPEGGVSVPSPTWSVSITSPDRRFCAEPGS